MHKEVRHFIKAVKSKHPKSFKKKKVLEVGSLNINGSVRKYFWLCDYTGIDLAEGKGVDKVVAAHKFYAYGVYDCVISTEMLEHDQHWKDSLRQMYNNLKTGGLLILTCAGPSRPEHGTRTSEPECSPFTNDYYRNISIEDFSTVLSAPMFTEFFIGYDRGRQDLMFYGIKR